MITRPIVPIILTLLLTFGCAMKQPIRPGAVDRFDSEAFGVLGAAAISIEHLVRNCPSGPDSPCPQYEKDAINQIIDAYEAAKIVLNTYHNSVLAAQVTGQQTDPGNLTAALAQVSIALDAYVKIKQLTITRANLKE